MTIQPAPKTNELEDKIEWLINQRRKPNKIDILRLKKEANNLRGKIDESKYFSLFGSIADLENDRLNLIDCYKKAIALSPNDYAINFNYAASLFRKGLIKQSLLQRKLYFDKFHNHSEVVLFYIHNNYYSCKFNEALYLLSKLDNKEEYSFYKKLVDIVDIVEQAQLTDDVAQHLCQLAYSILETQNLYFSSRGIEIIDNCIVYTIYVDSPVKDIAKINRDLSKLFVETLEDTWCDVLMFQYSSIEVLEAREKHERIV